MPKNKTLYNLLETCICHAKDNVYNIELINSLFNKTLIDYNHDIIVFGPIHRRYVYLSIDDNYYLLCINGKISELKKASIFKYIKKCNSVKKNIYLIDIDKEFIFRIKCPRINLISLYHPEYFPLPRFALNIHDLAGEIRKNYYGQVTLSDMQLGENVQSICNRIEKEKYEIIGISVTFGQHDILENILGVINDFQDYRPLIIVGGSLAFLNYKYLLDKYPGILISMGYGEDTIKGVIEYWYGERVLKNIDYISYVEDDRNLIVTDRTSFNRSIVPMPELDLLDKILDYNGVLQWEFSRGCQNACAFCPRTHKGNWNTYSVEILKTRINCISDIFKSHKNIANKFFIVDEEFFGPDSAARPKHISDIVQVISKKQFTFEICTRIDQVYNNKKNFKWHVERIGFWKYLRDHGLEKVLFGIESGVDSVLQRFNKKTTKLQNIYAIRMLSLCNIPVRYTYITFDPLMDLNELVETYKFQGRKDLLLKNTNRVSDAELLKLIKDENYVASESLGVPLYKKIPYLLVSLECLINSPYLNNVEKMGLVYNSNVLMGEKSVHYLNPDIGLLSYFSQLWIDRNFAIDYTLKSLIKIAEINDRQIFYDLRSIIKDYSYRLLGKFLYLLTQDDKLLDLNLQEDEITELNIPAKTWEKEDQDQKKYILTNLIDLHYRLLLRDFLSHYTEKQNDIKYNHSQIIERELAKWNNATDWVLINNSNENIGF